MFYLQFVVQSLVSHLVEQLRFRNESAVEMAASSDDSATVQDVWNSNSECVSLFLILSPQCLRSESEEEPERVPNLQKPEEDIAPIFIHSCLRAIMSAH